MTNIAGTAVTIELTLLQDDGSTPQDVSSATLTWRLTRAYSVPGVLEVLDADMIKTDANIGRVDVPLDATDTLDLQGTYYHEIKADFGVNNEKTWQLGTLTFSESSVAGD